MTFLHDSSATHQEPLRDPILGPDPPVKRHMIQLSQLLRIPLQLGSILYHYGYCEPETAAITWCQTDLAPSCNPHLQVLTKKESAYHSAIINHCVRKWALTEQTDSKTDYIFQCSSHGFSPLCPFTMYGLDSIILVSPLLLGWDFTLLLIVWARTSCNWPVCNASRIV